MDLELNGKVALITAASRGIGRAVAHRLAAEGATVVLSSRDKDALDAAIQACGPVPGRLIAQPCDLSNPADTDTLIPEVLAAHGRLDVLVANTPGPAIKPFLETTTEDFATAYDLLVRPVLQLAHAAAKNMVQAGDGSIVFLTSTWVKQPVPGAVLSASMRSLISSLAKQMALELGPHGVRVNQLMPGATGTDRMRNIVEAKATANGTSAQQEIDKIVADIPLGRWAESEDIARAVAFLASPAAAFSNGAAVPVDGGAIRATL